MAPKPSVSRRLLPNGLFRRSTLRCRLIAKFLICCIVWTNLESLYIYNRLPTGANLDPHPLRQGQLERIFIASSHWNNEPILRSHWNNAVIQLVETFGTDRIFVSIVESGSLDDTKGALRDLDADLDCLGARRNITLSETTHQDEISVALSPGQGGWIDTPRGRRELRRIPCLARRRNLSLRPLEDLARGDIMFDKVLFLNDVVFTVNDVVELLNTNRGDYAAALDPWQDVGIVVPDERIATALSALKDGAKLFPVQRA